MELEVLCCIRIFLLLFYDIVSIPKIKQNENVLVIQNI